MKLATDPVDLEPRVRGWIEDVAGSRVTAARRMGRWRPTWWVEVESSVAGRHLVLKTPRAPQHVVDRSAMLTQFGIDREAAVLLALQDTGVPVAPFVGHDPGRLLLIGVIAGEAELQAVSPPTRGRAMAEYGEALARLHDLYPARMHPPLNEVLRSVGPRSLPGSLAAVVEDSTRWAAPGDPLVELALRWLGEHEPEGLGSVVLHGDAGPNQFLVDATGLTALLDWELAYLGDPMSDLAYARYREALYPTGCYGELVDAYVAASGREVDRAVLDWYTVAACLVMLIGIARDVQRPRARNSEAVQRLWWDALSRAALCQVISEAGGGGTPRGVDGDGVTLLESVTDLLAQRVQSEPPADLRERRHTVALAQAAHRLSKLPPRAAAAAGWEALHARSVAEMAAMAPLAVSDTWGVLHADDDEVWRSRTGRPALPVVPD